MNSLFHNIRFYVLTGSILLAISIFLGVLFIIPEPRLQIIRLTQIYALTAITYLYFALLASPLSHVFPDLPFRIRYIKARRGIGVSAFLFALLHASFAFWGQLGGFSGLPYLSNTYLLAITFSFTALSILFIMTSTAFDKIVAYMTFPRWKKLHRLVYLAGILILIHALMLGTHFSDLSGLIPQITFIAVSFLLILEAIRFDHYLQVKHKFSPRFGISLTIMLITITTILLLTILPPTALSPLGIHSKHIQLAKEAQQSQFTTSNIPGLTGDKTKRYSVSFTPPEQITLGEPVELRFRVIDASNGQDVLLFSRLYEKIVHLIIVDETLTYFSHIHPEQDSSSFVITHTFPREGKYHLYLDFQPLGAIEQQFAFTLSTGQAETERSVTHIVDRTLTKTFNTYEVKLSGGPFIASKMTLGQQKISFTLSDAKTKKPITILKPYLAAFGHLVMINQKTYEYIHVHPFTFTPPPKDANGGPKVEFLPIGIYGPIKPGVYRVFAQFNPNNQLFTADFTIKVN